MSPVLLPVVLSGALPFLMTLVSKAGRFSARDNHETRAWQSRLSGWRQRAYWAHQNALETFPHFVAGALLAGAAAPASQLTLISAWAYPGLRIVYSAFYVADLASLRSVAWFASMSAVVGLFVAAAM